MGYPIRAGLETSFQHVMARGNNKEPIFFDVADYETYIRMLDNYVPRHRCLILAYCLMPNHVHFLIKPQGDMSNFMRDIHGAYGRYFNQRHRRRGHLFENRFRSRSIITNSNLLSVGRYIHMNPVEGGLTSDPLKFRWSSLRQYVFASESSWLETKILLTPHDGDRKKFLAFTTQSKDAGGLESNQFEAGSGVKLSTREIVERPSSPKSIDAILDRVAKVFGADSNQLRRSGRGVKPYGARAAAFALLRSELKLNPKEASLSLGYTSINGAINALRLLRERALNSLPLAGRIRRLGLRF